MARGAPQRTWLTLLSRSTGRFKKKTIRKFKFSFFEIVFVFPGSEAHGLRYPENNLILHKILDRYAGVFDTSVQLNRNLVGVHQAQFSRATATMLWAQLAGQRIVPVEAASILNLPPCINDADGVCTMEPIDDTHGPGQCVCWGKGE